MTKLGYQIPNFTYPGVGPADLFETIAAQAAAADRSGFDTVLLMDHFYQLAHLGPPENYMLECYTTLGALARETSTVRLAALVTGNTYRNPTLLAKTITALDIVSQGRAQLGIGAGWFELEHDSLGFEFGTFTDRFEKLEEALQIILPMLRDERPTLRGPALQREERDQPTTARRADPRDDRRRGREEDAAHGCAVRRRIEPDVTVARDSAQARSACGALRAVGAGPLGDRRQPAPQRVHQRHPRSRLRRYSGVPRRPRPRPRHHGRGAARADPRHVGVG